MKNSVLSILLFFIISFSNNLFSAEKTKITTDNLIKASLENELSPNSIIGRKIVVVVDEDVKDKSSGLVLIPQYSRMICKQNEVKRLDKIDVVFANCSQIFFLNSKKIDFKGSIFVKDPEGLKHGISTPSNVTIPKGKKVIVKLESNLYLD